MANTDPPLVLLVGRDPEEVPLEENLALLQRFGGISEHLALRRIDPMDPADHVRLCQHWAPVAVAVRGPSDWRLVCKALNEGGIPHVAYLQHHIKEPGEGCALMRASANGSFDPF